MTLNHSLLVLLEGAINKVYPAIKGGEHVMVDPLFVQITVVRLPCPSTWNVLTKHIYWYLVKNYFNHYMYNENIYNTPREYVFKVRVVMFKPRSLRSNHHWGTKIVVPEVSQTSLFGQSWHCRLHLCTGWLKLCFFLSCAGTISTAWIHPFEHLPSGSVWQALVSVWVFPPHSRISPLTTSNKSQSIVNIYIFLNRKIIVDKSKSDNNFHLHQTQ